jgi:DHA1 family multidrug resistance protein-like MFS transporter
VTLGRALGYAATMRRQGQPDWRLLLTLYWITSFVEGYGVAQVYAFLPNRLQEVGMSTPDIERFVGLLGALFFLTGLPLIPLWGVWADKYSRKAVIIRSALVEVGVFAVVAASREPWQLVIGVMLVAFQLGNTGVMMAAIRDVTPPRRLGLAMGIFAASSPLGFGAGPALGAVMIDVLHMTSGSVFAVAAIMSAAVALMLAVGSSEVRPEVVPQGSVLRLAFGAVRGVLSDRIVRWLFLIYGIVFLGRQMSTQYLALLVHEVEHTPLEVAGSVGLVLGVATIVGAALSPIGGWVADRVGFRTVMVVSMGGPGPLLCRPAARPHCGLDGRRLCPCDRLPGDDRGDGLRIARDGGSGRAPLGDAQPGVPAALPGRDSGPALGSTVVGTGLRSVFYLAALVLAGGLVVAIVFVRRSDVERGGRASMSTVEEQAEPAD